MKKIILLTLLGFVSWFNAEAQYCSSIADTGSSHDITKVYLNGNMGTLNNHTACGSLTGSQGTATGTAGRYSNFTTDTLIPRPSLKRGNTYSLTVNTKNCTTAGSSGIRMAFFDWNNDGDFLDTDEKVNIDAAFSTDTSKTVNFVVPTGSYSGKTRMRIVYRMLTSIGQMVPCGLPNFAGETEDYEIVIVDCSNQQLTILPGTSNYMTANITPYNANLTYTYQWKRNGTVLSGQTQPVLSYSPNDTGNYCVYVTASNGCLYDACLKIKGGTTSNTPKCS